MSRAPGKTVGYQTYVHVSAITAVNETFQVLLSKATEIAGVLSNENFNIARFDDDQSRVSLLFYADFFDAPFPELKQSWLVDLAAGTFTYRTYEDSQNPPILHRKELLIAADHPRSKEYQELTQSAESIGLFDNPTSIGFREQWNRLIRDKGYRIVGHQLLPIGNDESIDEAPSAPDGIQNPFGTISRHLTALVRYGFSAPVQTLARHGFLKEEKVFFDYGCGRGDDIRGLTENGLTASGWDPHYAPDNAIAPADIVNLGFVINVIENFEERTTALRRAYELSNELLVIAAMLANQNDIEGQRYADGIVTKRGTFQKYYTQTELKIFIEQTLAEEAIAVGPGIFYVFKDKDAEQRFLSERYRSRRTVLRQASRPFIERTPRVRRDRAEEKYQEFSDVLERLWEQWLALGREPDKSEVSDFLRLTEGFGTLRKALRFILSKKDPSILELAREARIADLQVYFALNQFEKRKPYRHLELGLQRDIRAFFGDYRAAQQAARDLLFKIAEPGAISDACDKAAERGLGWLVSSESLQLHTSLVEQLPPLLRVYVGCAAALYGDHREADLIKIHIRSGKLTLMRFDNFIENPLPRMIERVKIKLREQDIEYYAYGELYSPPYLYKKSRFINEEFKNYPEQLAFENELEKLGFFDFSGYGPKPELLHQILEKNRRMIEGFKIIKSQRIPEIDESCGKYLKYRSLIECGETQELTQINNLPSQPDTYTALHELSINILDPVIEYFGMIKLTYGFCSPALSKKIHARIAPSIDQHASNETKKNGEFICERLGAAVDFLVEYEDMLEVAEWIATHTPFDRIYYYGTDRPIHVSYGPENKKEFIEMTRSSNGKLIPKIRRPKNINS
jgi:DNA phosphorothioation-associated putative methyltransferase